MREVTLDDRRRFLLEYIELLEHERVRDDGRIGHDRWVVNKIRALASWYTKGLDRGSLFRTAVNSAASLSELIDTIVAFTERGAGDQTTVLRPDDLASYMRRSAVRSVASKS